MTLEALLAALHLLAVLTLVVFSSSQAALCRIEWLNAAVVRRLVRLDGIYWLVALALLLSGLARLYWGTKGVSWYVSQPLFHVKMTLFVLALAFSIQPSIAFRRWLRALDAGQALPDAHEVVRTRRWIMRQAHLVPVMAVLAAFWARGW